MFELSCKPVPFDTLMQRSRSFTPTAHHSAPPVAQVVENDDYAIGLADGQQLASVAFEADRVAMQKLLAGAHSVDGGNHDELSVLLRETVLRLVEQIVGQVEIDRTFMDRQIAAATALISETDAVRTLWLNPQDHLLFADGELPLPAHVDPALERGNLRIDCSGGWIEHGIAHGLTELRQLFGPEGEKR
ncbi:flagellar biosynthetic protein [Nostoc sp. HG1]|nr:flagellar biosynthetic protein [Nostoc sp. HG1]